MAFLSLSRPLDRGGFGRPKVAFAAKRVQKGFVCGEFSGLVFPLFSNRKRKELISHSSHTTTTTGRRRRLRRCDRGGGEPSSRASSPGVGGQNVCSSSRCSRARAILLHPQNASRRLPAVRIPTRKKRCVEQNGSARGLRSHRKRTTQNDFRC